LGKRCKVKDETPAAGQEQKNLTGLESKRESRKKNGGGKATLGFPVHLFHWLSRCKLAVRLRGKMVITEPSGASQPGKEKGEKRTRGG